MHFSSPEQARRPTNLVNDFVLAVRSAPTSEDVLESVPKRSRSELSDSAPVALQWRVSVFWATTKVETRTHTKEANLSQKKVTSANSTVV